MARTQRSAASRIDRMVIASDDHQPFVDVVEIG
jgi:hypothetical protein